MGYSMLSPRSENVFYNTLLAFVKGTKAFKLGASNLIINGDFLFAVDGGATPWTCMSTVFVVN